MAKAKSQTNDSTNEPTKAKASDPVTVELSVPIGTVPEGYENNQAEAGKLKFGRFSQKTQVQLSPDEAKAFLCIREGLLGSDMRLADGSPVTSNADVIRFLIAPFVEAVRERESDKDKSESEAA